MHRLVDQASGLGKGITETAESGAGGTFRCPPSAKPAFYAPLADLALPEHTRFHAGLVHDSPTVADQLHTDWMIEDALGLPIDGVACVCRLGRWPICSWRGGMRSP